MYSSSDDDDDVVPSFLAQSDLSKEPVEPSARSLKRKAAKERKRLESKGVNKEEDLDELPRQSAISTTSSWNSSAVERLPVKKADGTILTDEFRVDQGSSSRPLSMLVYRAGEKRPTSEEKEDVSEKKEVEIAPAKKKKREEVHVEPEEKPSNAAQLLYRREKLKIEMARVAEDIMASPEDSVTQLKSLAGGTKMKQLIEMSLDPWDTVVQKLSILTLVVVFKDILPGYRIRLPTAQETSDRKLSREVKKLWQFEKGLLEHYQAFLKSLHSIVASSLGDDAELGSTRKEALEKPSSIAMVAMRAFCTLLVTKPYFNFRENLLANVIPRMNSVYPQVRELCCGCVSTLLDDDVGGDATLEVIVYVSKFIRARNNGLGGTVHSDLVKCLLRCTLNADLKDQMRAELAKESRMTKKQKRKKRDEVSIGLEEANADVDKYHKHAKQVESLRELFTMFLRILKRAPRSPIVPVTLQGVAKYVHLINLDIAQGLISVLSEMMKSENCLTLEAGFQTILTISKTIQGPGKDLYSDESGHVTYLYHLILELTTHTDRDKLVLLCIRCIEAVFLGRKQYQHSRVASVVCRLAVVANFVSPHSILALVSTIRSLTFRYSSVCRPLMDSEDSQGEGNSLALGLPPSSGNGSIDPALMLKDSPVLWPLAQLRFHYHPHVRAFVTKALDMVPILPSDRPAKLFSSYNPSLGGFNPPIPKTMIVKSIKRFKKRNRNANSKK